MNIGVVVLAAGEAKRFGAPKLLVPVDGVPLVRRAVLAALDTATQVVVVIGAQREAVEACVADLDVARTFNENWCDGMGGSIACGVAALGEGCRAAIFALADQPLVGRAEFDALIAAYARTPECIVAAQFDGVLGPPCLFPRRYFRELAGLCGEQGARSLLQRHADRVVAVPLRAAAIDIDTPEDLARLRK